MPLHLIKLCVGIDTPEALGDRIAARLEEERLAGREPEHGHVTRVMPKRATDILEGGSLYWVIRAKVQVRQRVLRFDAVTGADGIERCRIVLEPILYPTLWQPRRAFQGWRYLSADEAPADLAGSGEGVGDAPPELVRELAELGLL